MPWELPSTDMQLVLATLVMTFLTFLAYRVGQRTELRSKLASSLTLLASIFLTFALAWCTFGRLMWAEAIVASSAVSWSNVTSVMLAFSAGFALHAAGVRRRYRSTLSAMLMVMAVTYVAMPIARPVFFPLDLQEQSDWKDGVCMQSHESSCAPAAASTLLKMNGIHATEADLSRHCLSSRLGTPPLGLYRGLSQVADQHGLQAQIADRDPEHWVLQRQLPCVAVVQFEPIAGFRNTPRFLGRRASGHVVTVLGQTDGGRWLIGDPAVGRVSWSAEEFNERFTGEAIYLSNQSSRTARQAGSRGSCRNPLLCGSPLAVEIVRPNQSGR